MLKPVLELLAGVPTVVYGYFALNFVTPILRNVLGGRTVDLFNMASAGLVIGILILPLVALMSEDALSACRAACVRPPTAWRALRLETVVNIVVPAALFGLGAAFIVAISRAVGETMVVAIAAGSGLRNFAQLGEALKGLENASSVQGRRDHDRPWSRASRAAT